MSQLAQLGQKSILIQSQTKLSLVRFGEICVDLGRVVEDEVFHVQHVQAGPVAVEDVFTAVISLRGLNLGSM